jgi:hypothetical protein
MGSHGTFSAQNPADFAATALQDPSIAGRSPDAHFKAEISALWSLSDDLAPTPSTLVSADYGSVLAVLSLLLIVWRHLLHAVDIVHRTRRRHRGRWWQTRRLLTRVWSLALKVGENSTLGRLQDFLKLDVCGTSSSIARCWPGSRNCAQAARRHEEHVSRSLDGSSRRWRGCTE